MRARREALQEVGADLQRAGAADGLHGDRTFLLNHGAVGTKYQLLHRLVVGSQAFDRQVGARRRLRDQHFFRFLYARQQRHFAIVVIIDAHAQVDFGRILVGIKCFGNAQDRVAWGHVDGAEEAGRNGRVRHDKIGFDWKRFAADSRQRPSNTAPGRWQAIILTKV